MKLRLRVLVKTGSRTPTVARNPDGTLFVAVTARPIKGQANQAVIAALAEFRKIPKSRIRLIAGQTSRWKTFVVPD